ncbi:hypothetical protein DL767_010347 [Monosporascus sp. MG133]|nr:hypothetical protein DL767_010347 [Monosporascus sp. MG133]
MNSLSKIGEEYDRLQKEQREVEEALTTLFNRLKRLRLQQDILRKRAVAILKEGFERDQQEDQERLEKEQRRIKAEQAQLDSEIDAVVEASTSLGWNAEGLDLGGGPLSPATLAILETVGQDFADENPQPGPSYSSGA